MKQKTVAIYFPAKLSVSWMGGHHDLKAISCEHRSSSGSDVCTSNIQMRSAMVHPAIGE
jgi:hypothetical protein